MKHKLATCLVTAFALSTMGLVSNVSPAHAADDDLICGQVEEGGDTDCWTELELRLTCGWDSEDGYEETGIPVCDDNAPDSAEVKPGITKITPPVKPYRAFASVHGRAAKTVSKPVNLTGRAYIRLHRKIKPKIVRHRAPKVKIARHKVGFGVARLRLNKRHTVRFHVPKRKLVKRTFRPAFQKSTSAMRFTTRRLR